MERAQICKNSEINRNMAESVKALRTNIFLCGDDFRSILFTSCFPNEGKSSIVFELSKSITEVGKSVVLLDTDLRKSVLVGRYGISDAPYGLTHFLAGQNKLVDIIYETNIPNMFLIHAGTEAPNPAELLSNQKFEKMMEVLKKEFDYVLIDAAPLGSVIDAAIIAGHADGCVLVIEHNAVSIKLATDIKHQIEKTNCKLLGAVLNKVPIDKKGYYGKYYGNYYGKY